MEAVDISYPSAPKHLGSYDGFRSADSLAVRGNYVFLAGLQGLEVVDISNAAAPARVGQCNCAGGRITLANQYAFLAAGNLGMQVLDISNPTDPKIIGAYQTGGVVLAVDVVGRFAFLADLDLGIEVVDISDPAHPFRIAGNGSLLVVGSHVFTVNRSKGLQVFRMHPVITSFSASASAIDISWESVGPGWLQRATSLSGLDWQDVPGSDGTNRAILPLHGSVEFFRLASP